MSLYIHVHFGLLEIVYIQKRQLVASDNLDHNQLVFLGDTLVVSVHAKNKQYANMLINEIFKQLN